MSGIANFCGEIEKFDVNADRSTLNVKWSEWKSSVKYMITAKGITNEGQKEAVLLHAAGRDVQKIYETLPEPSTVPEGSTAFDKALLKLDTYFAGKTNAPYERHKFRKMKQETSETVAHFVSRLKRQAEFCSFGEDLNTQVRDQLIEGCLAPRLRRQFLEKGNDLTLDTAVILANNFEAVRQQAGEMQETVNRVEEVKQRPKPNAYKRQAQNKSSGKTDKTCWKCGRTGHFANDPSCPAKDKSCKQCGKVGHFAIVCKSKDKASTSEKKGWNRKNPRKDRVFGLEDSEDEEVFTLSLAAEDEPYVNIKVGGQVMKVLIDSGATCNVVDEGVYEMLKSQGISCTTHKVNKILKPYASLTRLEVREKFVTTVQVGDNTLNDVEFLVVKGKAKSLLGRRTATQIGLLEIKIPEINLVEDEFGELFSGKVGKLTDCQVELHLKEDAKLTAQACRRIPFSLRPKLENKVKELQAMDIIERVEGPTPCVSPVVIVNKPDGDIRLCVDMRLANTAIERTRHPIPTVDEVLNDLSGDKIFTKLDLKMGFHQLELKEGVSRDITTFTTHVGLFRYKRLMFGICSAPEIYQHIIQQVLVGAGCEGCRNISDDIVVSGKNVDQHDQRLRKVLHTLQERGLTLNKEKCSFRMSEVEFMGHLLSSKGIGPTESRVRALKEAAEPRNASEVRSFLGLVNFSSRYISNLATRAEPLRKLTKKDEPFIWGEEQKEAFQDLKNALTDFDTLAYYDPDAEIKVVADASPVGLGSVLLQRKNEEGWKPVSFASRSLSDTEKRYSQTEKEALALVWSAERFRMYLLGKEFELETDHKPLESIYSAKSKTSARIERWVLRLLPYQFWVTYRPGKQNLADPLSRLIKNKRNESFDDTEDYVNFISVKATPKAMKFETVEQASEDDEEMRELKRCIQTGTWEGARCSEYLPVANELCVVGKVIMRGTRIVIPRNLRSTVMTIGHEGHPGVVSMKQRLRTKVWWPKMEKNIASFVKVCAGCQLVSQPEPPEPVSSTELPSGPWEKIGIDFLGPLPSNDYIFIAVDYYSRYYEAEVMRSTITEKTINSLETMFARFGLPEEVVSDNGPQFISEQFSDFMETNGIRHRKVTPKWAPANGEVERQNRSILKRLKIAQIEGKDWRRELVKYLAVYRTTPHPATGKTPAEMLMGRQLRTKLPQLSDHSQMDEEVRDRDKETKLKNKKYIDQRRHAKLSELKPGDLVLKKQDKQNKLSSTFEAHLYRVLKKNGNQLVIADCEDETRLFKRNISHVKGFYGDTKYADMPEQSSIESSYVPEYQLDTKNPEIKVEMPNPSIETKEQHSTSQEVKTSGVQEPRSSPRPVRQRKVPERFKDYVIT